MSRCVECWADEQSYNPILDLAVRDWGRRDAAIATRVQRADEQRLLALIEMFARHGFDDSEALVRARLLYHSQSLAAHGRCIIGPVE